MRPWRRSLSVPKHAHPLIHRLFTEMNAQHCGLLDMSERSGINKNTLKDWRIRSQPRISDLDACLNVLGLELYIRRKES